MHTGSDRQTVDANGGIGLGGGHVTSQEKSLISGSSLLLLKHCKWALYPGTPTPWIVAGNPQLYTSR